jgi:hypothetical protein
MSKHPRYLAIDEARMKEIQRAFDEFCKDKFTLVKKDRQAKNQPEGYMDWPLFKVKNMNGEVVATFDPKGIFELFDRKFKRIYDKMVTAIEKVAKEETKKVKLLELRERAEMHGFNPTFYQKEKEEKENKD